MVEKLINIHNNPSFYAGYYLNKVKEGSLGKRGDSHSEQNHASIISYLGEGGNLEIFEQISKLLERHRNQVALKTESDGELQLIIQRFKSQLQGYEDIADNKARKALSDHAYNSFFLTTIRKAFCFQVTEEKESSDTANDNNDGEIISYKVYPCNISSFESTPSNERYQFTSKERCQYHY